MSLGVELRSLMNRLREGGPLRRGWDGQDLAERVEHVASETGTHFSHLYILDLSRSDLSPEGLGSIGRGWPILKILTLVGCQRIDDAVVIVLSGQFLVLRKVHLCDRSRYMSRDIKRILLRTFPSKLSPVKTGLNLPGKRTTNGLDVLFLEYEC